MTPAALALYEKVYSESDGKNVPTNARVMKEFGVSFETADSWKTAFKTSLKVAEAKEIKADKKPFDLHHLVGKDTVKIGFAIVALAGIYRSFGYVYSWYMRLGNSEMDSIISGILFVGCNFLIPLAVILKFQEVKKLDWTSYVLIFILVPIMFFTMTTAIGGIYESHSGRVLSEQSVLSNGNKDNLRLIEIKARTTSLEASKALTEKEIAQRLQVQIGFQVGTPEYNRIANNIFDDRSRLDDIGKQLQSLYDEKQNLLKEASLVIQTVERKGFFDFIDSHFSLSAGTTELYSSLAVAVTLDIVGPVAAMVSFFL